MSRHNLLRKKIKWRAKGIIPECLDGFTGIGMPDRMLRTCFFWRIFFPVTAVAPTPAELVRIRKHGKKRCA